MLVSLNKTFDLACAVYPSCGVSRHQALSVWKAIFVQAAQLRLAQANNLADIEWSAGLRRMQGIDETALVAGISVSLFQKERNLGEYEAHRARLDAIELQKQSNLRSLLHSVNQALGEHTRALLEVETIQLNVIPPLKEALDLVESAYLEGRFSYLEWVTTRQEFLTTRLTLIEAED